MQAYKKRPASFVLNAAAIGQKILSQKEPQKSGFTPNAALSILCHVVYATNGFMVFLYDMGNTFRETGLAEADSTEFNNRFLRSIRFLFL